MKNILCEKNNLKYTGRFTWVDDVIYLGYSGSSVEFITDSSTIVIEVVTDKVLREEIFYGRVAVYIDSNENPICDKMLSSHSMVFEIAIGNDNSKAEHTVRIEKLSEAAFGLVGLRSIDVEEDSIVKATEYRERKIEFIGDSITCGYGVETSKETDIFSTNTENAEKAYAIKTARALDADYSLVSWSGIGIISDWVPETVNEPLEDILMPELYFYRDLNLSKSLDINWEKNDFSIFTPDLIVVNIGTNDDSYVRTIPSRQQAYGDGYQKFIQKVHENNPDSAILCILGTMGQNLCEEVEKQVEIFREKNKEVVIDYLKMPEQDRECDGIAADFHPSEKTQVKASQFLISKISEIMNW